jgi:hypothetical protein
MYWELEKAMKEIKERKKEGVSKKVREWFRKNEIPFPLPSLGKKIAGVLFRHIATARFEDIQFEQRCREVDLVAINFEFKEDIFVECNPSKMRLIRLYLFDGFGKRGGEKIKRIDLIDPNRISEIKGLPISEIEVNGGRLWEVHHKMRKKIGLNSKIIDLSPWLKQIGRAKDYYKYLMLIFISDAILFESFESPGFPDLEEFKEKVVIPAREFAVDTLGLEPIIVYHPDCEQDFLGRLLGEDKVLRYYPAEVAEVL